MASTSDMDISEYGFTVRHKELSQLYTDRTGHLSPWSIHRIYQDIHSFISKPFFAAALFDRTGATLFIVREKHRYYPEVLRNSCFPRGRTYITTKSRLICTGTTSFIYREYINLEKTGGLLHQRDVLVIAVDINTRRPNPLPIHIKNFQNLDKSPIQNKSDILKAPNNCFRSIVRIRPGHLDVNMHTNAAEYFRFMMDCATEASLSGYFRKFTLDMCWYPLVDVDVSYLGESTTGDLLDLCCWQDDNDSQKIFFVFFLKQRSIFQGICIFDTEHYSDFSKSNI